MGLKGNLAVVNLADVFQMLSRGKSSGLLRVQAPEGTRFIELQDGFISLAGRATQYIQLGDLLLSRKAINDENLSTAMKIHRENGMVLGQVLIEMNYVKRADLDESLRFLIEEEVCDLFTLREGEFDFLANASLDTKIAPGGGAVRLRIDPDSLLLEAARRADEWRELEQRITTQSLLFRLTEEGMRVYQDADGISDEGRTIMRLLQALHSVEGIVQKSCLGRLNTNRMILELWDAQLIEAVPKAEYLAYAKSLTEAGQFADAHRIAVHASKVGSPDTIKLAISMIEGLRKQLSPEDKSAAGPAAADRKMTSSANIKKPSFNTNLIIKKQPLPWGKIALIVAALLGAAAAATYYAMNTVDPNAIAQIKLDKLKADAMQLVYQRKFSDALQTASRFGAPNADFKIKHDKIKRDVLNEIETQFARDFGSLASTSGITKVTSAEVTRYNQQYVDFDGVEFESKSVIRDYKNIGKILKGLEEDIKSAEFRSKLDELRRNLQQLPQDKLVTEYRALLKSDPPEPIAKDARADLYKLLLPNHEAERLVSQAREMLANGGFDVATRMCDTVKTKFPGTKLSDEAEQILKEINTRTNTANDELARIRKLMVQRKSNEARRLATQLLASKPPADVQSAVLVEMRKLQPENAEEDVQKALALASRSQDIDAKQSRAKIIEIVNAHPFSEAVSVATLRVPITSSPEGATVFYKEQNRGKTPLMLDLPVMGPVAISFNLVGFEPFELVENNFRGDKIQAVFVRKPQASILAPVLANAGMLAFKNLLLLAGGNELTVCNARTLEVLRRVNLESTPLPNKVGEKREQPAALAKNELKLRALSVNEEDAEAWVFVSCTGSYFFQIPSNGVDFYRVPCDPGAVAAPEMYRPKKAGGFKLISVVTKSSISVYSAERQIIPPPHEIPTSGSGQEQPIGLAFDGDTYYVPRDNNYIYAVEGYRGDIKWKKPCENRISLPPAVNAENKTVAFSDVKGHVFLLDTDTYGKEKGHSDLAAASSMGLTAAKNGFVAALDDNTLVLIPSSGGPPAWVAQLPGKVMFTPLVRNPERKDKNGIAAALVCCETANNSYVVIAVNLNDGSLFWRGRLASKPICGAVSSEAVYIETVENELVKFDFSLPSTN